MADPGPGSRRAEGIATATKLSLVTCPNTGGWQTYQTVSSAVVFGQTGVQTIRVYGVSGGWNLNWINFVKVPELLVNNAQSATEISDSQVTLTGALAAAADTDTTSVTVYWGPTDGETTAANWTGGSYTWDAPQSAGVPLAHTFGGFASETLYFFRFYAEDAVTHDWADATATWITAPVTLNAISDASEIGLVPGTFRVTRPSSVTGGPLVVHYSASGGAAVADQNYVALSGSVTIPQGQVTADITVAPLADWATQADRTLELSLTSGGYLIGTPSTASITIANAPLPGEPNNVWIAPANGNASVGSNWSLGHAPTASETALLGEYSVKNLTWDAAAGDTVGAWVQESGYTGAVTFETTFPAYSADFTNFTVLGDVTLSGGTWTHRGNGGSEEYCLNTTVGGSLIVAANASITADERGYGQWSGPGLDGQYAGSSYGGEGHRDAWGANVPNPKTYGSVLNPVRLGSGSSGRAGGGFLHLTVAGAVALDGGVSVMGGGSHNQGGGGSGGSIKLSAAALSGNGTIRAQGGYDGWHGSGGGGRIALRLTQAGADFGTFTGTVQAYGNDFAFWDGRKASGAGTIYKETADNGSGGGVVVVRDVFGWSQDGQHWSANLPAETPVAEDLSGTSWELRDFGHVRLRDNVKIASMRLYGNNTRLKLDGKTLTLTSFTDKDGEPVASAGRYTDNSSGLFDNVDFSVADSAIEIPSLGTVITVR